MQVANHLLIELLGQHTSPDAAVTAASESAPLQNNQAEYAAAGLAELAASDECMTLQSSILRCIMLTTEHPKDCPCLGKHVFPVCLPPFLKYAQSSMDRYVQTGKAAVTLLDLRSHVVMLGRLSGQCYLHACDQLSCTLCDVEYVAWWMSSICKSSNCCNGDLPRQGRGPGAYASCLLVMSHASVAVYITQAVIHQHDRSLLHDMCQQCL